MQSAVAASSSLDSQRLKEMSGGEKEALTAAPFLQLQGIKQQTGKKKQENLEPTR